jgi:putative ABC transport system permease protein
MKDSPVFANLFRRKTRTALTVVGVALGVVLIVLTVGLINGFLKSQGERNSAVTAEIMMRSVNSKLGLGFESTARLSLPMALIDEIEPIEGIQAAIPVGQFLQETHLIDGINYEAFTKVSDLRVVEGEPIQRGNEMIIDRTLQRNWKLKVGDMTKVFGQPFRIVGIYEPESLGRFKIPLSTMQSALHRPFLCSMILIKVEDPARQDELAAHLREHFPNNSITLTRDLPSLFAGGTPALQVFKKVVVGLAVFVSSLVMLLAMYTTVKERTKLIGILKSLGASKFSIAAEVQKEAGVISFLGVSVGFALSLAGKLVIESLTPMKVELETQWFLYSLLLGLTAGAIGALYPALKAANQDPVIALHYD